MWRTSKGDRTLGPAEAQLFLHAAQLFAHALFLEMEASSAAPSGNQFQRLPPTHGAIVCADILIALTDPNVPTPTLTAVNEAAISDIFRHLELDLEDPDEETGRRVQALIVAALQERGLAEPENPDDPEDWDTCMEELLDQILWDRDFADESDYVDLPPDKANAAYSLMRVDREYFQHIVPEPTNADIERLMAKIRSLRGEDKSQSNPNDAT